MVRWRVLVWDLWRRRCSMGLRRRLRRAFSLITSKRYTFREHDPAAAAPVGQCVWEGGLWVRCAGESHRRCRGPPRGSRSSAALQGTSRKIDPPSLKTALPWRPRCLRPCASELSGASRSRRPSRWRWMGRRRKFMIHSNSRRICTTNRLLPSVAPRRGGIVLLLDKLIEQEQ